MLIAGTNGKGSVAAMVAESLRAAGYRTGRYTSPHLTHLEERFAVDGTPVEAARLDAALARVRETAGALAAPPTYFEATTAAAFELFREARVDVAVLEVGLGGRLDATNVVDPVAAAITSIDLDHTAQLGPDVAAIAGEKAGVIRPGIPVVFARNPPEAREVVAAAAAAVGARLIEPARDTEVAAVMSDGRATLTAATPHRRYERVRLGLRGRYQVDNALVALRLLEELAGGAAPALGAAAIRAGLERAVWPARLELRSWQGHDVLLDAAHNAAGARALAAHLAETYGRRLPVVLAVMRDKAVDEMLTALAPAASHFAVTSVASSRALPAEQLAARARAMAPGVPVHVDTDAGQALARAVSWGSPVVVAGSLHLAGEIRPQLT